MRLPESSAKVTLPFTCFGQLNRVYAVLEAVAHPKEVRMVGSASKLLNYRDAGAVMPLIRCVAALSTVSENLPFFLFRVVIACNSHHLTGQGYALLNKLWIARTNSVLHPQK